MKIDKLNVYKCIHNHGDLKNYDEISDIAKGEHAGAHAPPTVDFALLIVPSTYKLINYSCICVLTPYVVTDVTIDNAYIYSIIRLLALPLAMPTHKC